MPLCVRTGEPSLPVEAGAPVVAAGAVDDDLGAFFWKAACEVDDEAEKGDEAGAARMVGTLVSAATELAGAADVKLGPEAFIGGAGNAEMEETADEAEESVKVEESWLLKRLSQGWSPGIPHF